VPASGLMDPIYVKIEQAKEAAGPSTRLRPLRMTGIGWLGDAAVLRRMKVLKRRQDNNQSKENQGEQVSSALGE